MRDEFEYRVHKLIVDNYGLGVTSGYKTGLYQVASEIKNASDKINQSTYLEINAIIAQRGLIYIDEQLEAGYPVVVGTDHTHRDKKSSGKDHNEGTTDHFIVILGRGCTEKQTYYIFYEVAVKTSDEGTSDENKLFLYDDLSLRGGTAFKKDRNYVVTQIRKNVLK